MSEIDSTYSHLLRLLSMSLYSGSAGSAGSLNSTLSDRQWYKVMEEAEKQTVTGIIFGAISRLPENELPPVSVLANWLAMAHRDSRRYAAMSEVLYWLLPMFKSNGLHPVLQKGHAASRFYHMPELRTCGDIDLWFPGNERSEADNIIRKMNHKIINTPDNGSCYLMDSTEVEHHSMLIEIHNPFKSRMVDDLINGNEARPTILPHGVTADVPAPIVELLMFNIHILKHCLGVGIGLRQFCDYALAWRNLTDRDALGDAAVDPGCYLDLCRRLGIIEWTRALHQFINRYLPSADGNGVAEIPGNADTNAVERIFTLVTEGGNFGKYSRNRRAYIHKNIFSRKVHTMSTFINNRSFVYRLAPAEAVWTFTRLLLGQIH